MPAVGVRGPAGGVEAAALAVLDPTTAARVDGDLARVEEALAGVAADEEPEVTAPARYLIDAGGKRFRPLLTLLAAGFGDPDAPGVVPAAVVVELTHLATLYHDDVMDEAQLRRGARAANRVYGNTVAILTGDYLFARASDIASDLGEEVVRIQSRTFARLVRGQIRETAGPAAGADPLAHYLSVVADKTASLVATAARLGALLAGAPADQVAILRDFGERVGVAFQLADDLLDVTAQSPELGKTPGTDLREGVRTLPVLLALASPGPRTDALATALRRDLSDDAALADTLQLVQEHPAFGRAQEFVEEQVRDAHALLAQLPACPARHALADVAAAVASRRG